MKTAPVGDGTTKFVPEDDNDRAALEWVSTHAPIIAGMEPYGVAAFLAGARWAAEGTR